MSASRSLRAILDSMSPGESIQDSEVFSEFQTALEFFLPEELGMRDESFDAFRFAIARKVGGNEAEFVGLALLITDQTWTPIHLRLRLSCEADEFAAVDCRLGEPGEGRLGLVRMPYESGRAVKFLHRLPERLESVQWVFRAVRSGD